MERIPSIDEARDIVQDQLTDVPWNDESHWQFILRQMGTIVASVPGLTETEVAQSLGIKRQNLSSYLGGTRRNREIARSLHLLGLPTCARCGDVRCPGCS